MSSMRPATRNLARWLISHETTDLSSGEGQTLAATMPVFAKLRERLVLLVGKAGFRSVIARALYLAKSDVPELKTARISEEGILTLDDSGDPAAERNGAGFATAGEILVGHFLELFFTFIGVPLTLRIVRDIWADAPYSDNENENDSKIKETP